MKKIDKRIKKSLEEASPEMPDDVSIRFEETLERLEKNSKKVKRAPKLSRFAAAAAMLAVVFVGVINLSRNMAYALQKIPVIGELISVITVHKLSDEGDKYILLAQTPSIEDNDSFSEQTELINDDVQSLTDAAIKEFYAYLEEEGESYTELKIDYEVVTNTDEWFTLRVYFDYITASSGTSNRFYHIDKKRGVTAELSDMFDGDFDYVSVFSREVIRQAKKQMKESDDVMYFIGDDEDDFKSIAPNENFYFNSDEELVLVFEKYEIAPGYMGNPEFVIPKELYVDRMK